MNPTSNDRALAPAQWVKFLERAGVVVDTPTRSVTSHAKAIAAGKYLAAKVGRTVPVCAGGRTGRATLRVVAARANQKRYWFEVEWDDGRGDDPGGALVAPSQPPSAATEQPDDARDRGPTEPSVVVASGKGGNDEVWE